MQNIVSGVFAHESVNVENAVAIGTKYYQTWRASKYLVMSFNLPTSLQQNQIEVRFADGDADLPIATTAVECAEAQETVLVGDDTDLLVLLWHYLPEINNDVIMQTRSWNWDIKLLKQHNGKINDMILFVHAFFGCDTVSQLHGIAKDMVFKTKD